MNADNPYAAPKSVVADIDHTTSLERPPQVARGVKLMWIAIPVGLMGSIINLATFAQPGIPKGTQVGLTLSSLAIGFAITAWLIISAGKGKNWARIVQLVFVCFGALSSIMLVMTPMPFHWSVWVLYFAQMALNIAAMVFLFSSPANEWYRALKR
jgi:hypothetical protein